MRCCEGGFWRYVIGVLTDPADYGARPCYDVAIASAIVRSVSAGGCKPIVSDEVASRYFANGYREFSRCKDF